LDDLLVVKVGDSTREIPNPKSQIPNPKKQATFSVDTITPLQADGEAAAQEQDGVGDKSSVHGAE